MTLLPADWAVVAAAAALFIFGAVAGLSGVLAFAVSTVSAAAAAVFLWPVACGAIPSKWAAGAAVFAASLVVFALARWIVKKTVHVMVAQPADSLFGIILALALSAAAVCMWARTGFYTEYSYIAASAARWVM